MKRFSTWWNLCTMALSTQPVYGAWPGNRHTKTLVCFLSLPSTTKGTRNEDFSLSLSNIFKEPKEWRGKGLSSPPHSTYTQPAHPFPTLPFQRGMREVALGLPLFYLATLWEDHLLQGPLHSAICDINSWSVRPQRELRHCLDQSNPYLRSFTL